MKGQPFEKFSELLIEIIKNCTEKSLVRFLSQNELLRLKQQLKPTETNLLNGSSSSISDVQINRSILFNLLYTVCPEKKTKHFE